MACFASYRRSGWVRFLVLILCALFIFATIGAPPAHALGVESVAVFGLASVLSAATAALGFKLSSNEQGQATLQRMVQDFKTVAWATGFVLVGSKLNGLQNGMDYIKMQVKEGKTYLDARVFAWVQQWLSNNGVYASDSVLFPSYSVGQSITYAHKTISEVLSVLNLYVSTNSVHDLINHYNIDLSDCLFSVEVFSNGDVFISTSNSEFDSQYLVEYREPTNNANGYYYYGWPMSIDRPIYKYYYYPDSGKFGKNTIYATVFPLTVASTYSDRFWLSNIGDFSISSNSTGLSGTDTLGNDYVNKTLEQILAGLKEWAQDWFDAGADSATNAATGALDLPLTVATGAATANPSIAEDGPLVWFPPFSVPIPNLRTGETDTKTVDQGKENASAAETSTVDVAENQSVIDSLVNWALSYISPDTGLFSKFPLCVPYDAYLLVTSSLGVDAVGSDSIFGASPGDLDGVVNQDIETYSDFQPIINIKHDFELDGATYPIELTIDLTPWQPLVTFFREGMALLLVAELIGAEFKRIRGH